MVGSMSGVQSGEPEGNAACAASAVPVRGAAGEQYNPGPPTPPRQAAAVILLRDGERGMEVLLVQRTPKARFMGGVWVFPGGAVRGARAAAESASEDVAGEAHREAACRELGEEAGVSIPDPDALVLFARWITPARVRIRFDTRFYLARLPAGALAEVDGEECVALDWFTPGGALEAHAHGAIALVFPTIKQLEQLRGFTSVEEALERTRAVTVEPIEPRVVLGEDGSEGRIVLPGEPGYAEA